MSVERFGSYAGLEGYGEPLPPEQREMIHEYETEFILPPMEGIDRLEQVAPGMTYFERAKPRNQAVLADYPSGTVFSMRTFAGQLDFEIQAWDGGPQLAVDCLVLAKSKGDYLESGLIPSDQFAILGPSEGDSLDLEGEGVIQQYADLRVRPLTIDSLSDYDLGVMSAPAFDRLVASGSIMKGESGRYFRRIWVGDARNIPAVMSLERFVDNDMKKKLPVFLDRQD